MASTSSNAKILWGIASGAETLAAILEALEHNYLKATVFLCLGLTFLLFATGFLGPGPDKAPWRKALMFVLIFISIGLLIYQVAVKRLL